MTTFDQKLAEYLNNWVIEGWPVGNLILVLIAIILSVFLCGIIGIERERRGRSAGLRTHLLVGVGSCIIMIISIYGFPAIFNDHRDVARLAAQIITGVGFLGAGAIIHRNSGIKGLTTAGTIWIVMAIGVACGSFNFIIAIIGTLVIIFVLTVFRKLEVRINKKNPMIIMSVETGKPVLETILKVSKEFKCEVHGLSTEFVEGYDNRIIEYTFQAHFDSSASVDTLNEFISALEKETQATSVRLLTHK